MLGPKFIWHTDGYDIDLCINKCKCEFSRKIIWVNVYQTHNQPKLNGDLFLETAATVNGGCPSKKLGQTTKHLERRCRSISNISKVPRS